MSMIFFGMQLAMRAAPGDPWRTRLEALVRTHSRDLGYADQRGLWGSIANQLLDGVDRATLAFWDFVPDGKRQYDEWVAGIEDDSAEAWVDDRSGAALDHVLVSALFLLASDGASADVVGERCDLPEAVWRTRATWRHLLATLPMLDFASIHGNALYVTPGGPRAAFSLRELRDDGYDYLLPVE
jgi:hypothetical protein